MMMMMMMMVLTMMKGDVFIYLYCSWYSFFHPEARVHPVRFVPLALSAAPAREVRHDCLRRCPRWRSSPVCILDERLQHKLQRVRLIQLRKRYTAQSCIGDLVVAVLCCDRADDDRVGWPFRSVARRISVRNADVNLSFGAEENLEDENHALHHPSHFSPVGRVETQRPLLDATAGYTRRRRLGKHHVAMTTPVLAFSL